jgi:hypothetical protein
MLFDSCGILGCLYCPSEIFGRVETERTMSLCPKLQFSREVHYNLDGLPSYLICECLVGGLFLCMGFWFYKVLLILRFVET